MIKKAILGTVVCVLLSLFFFGRDALSYVRTSVGHVKDSVKASVPVEFEIERARRDIKDLEPAVQNAMHVIAKQEVDVEKLQKQIGDLEARLNKEDAELKKLHADARSGKETFEYGGRKYTLEQVRVDLSRRFDRLRTGRETFDTQRKIHVAREKALDAARDQLNGMLATRRELKVLVENLDARAQMVAAAQTSRMYSFDDSQLGRVKELVSDIQTRLQVSERLVNTEAYFGEEIPVNQSTPANIVDQIGEYFAKQQPTVAEAEKVKDQPVTASLAKTSK
jgi:chromosome segregation ATPase